MLHWPEAERPVWAVHVERSKIVDFDSLRNRQSILEFNAQIPHGAVHLRVPQQELNCTQIARLAHNYMIEVVERNAPSAETINDVMIGRRLVEDNTIRVVELAMEMAGGASYYRKAEPERRFRDIQAARYHPLQKEVQAEYAGAMALGHPVDRIF